MPVSPQDFKDVLRHFAAGVTVVTVKSGDDQHGSTVSAFASVSTEPPLILVCIGHNSRSHELMERSDAVFAVNILREEQEEASNRFAFFDGDRFAEGNWTTAETGAPIIEDSLAWLDCTIYSRLNAGHHTIYIGEVQASKVVAESHNPLLYWNRSYRQLAEKSEE